MERYLCKAKTEKNDECVIGYALAGKRSISYTEKENVAVIITNLNLLSNNGLNTMTSFVVKRHTLSQCTGRKDGNGKLIFEGDYFWIENAEGEIGVIYWYGMKWCVRSVPNTVENECVPDFDTTIEIYELEEFYSREIGIVGNVHDYKGENNGRE